MRIAMLAWESLHSIAVGGVAAHVSELAGVLASRGHQVHIFTRRMAGQRAHDYINGVHYHRCLYSQHRDFVDDVNNMCRSFVDRFFEVEDFVGKFDIVHAHDWLAANAMIWIKQGRERKTILTIHSTEYARCGNAFHNGQSVRIRTQERAGTYWADKIITVSQASKKEIMWMYEVPDSKICVIGNGVNWKPYDIEIDPGKIKGEYGIAPLDPTVLFCGRIVWQKGPDILVEAIPSILQKYSNAKFVFAGDGEMRGNLQTRVHKLGISHAVRFLGYKNGDELVRLFKASDVVCVPSRNEPFGIVVLEAWSASKPVIVTENGGPNEFVIHETNGLKIYPRPDSVSWGANRIFSDFECARQMGQNGRLLLEKRYGWDKITEQTLRVYRQVSSQSPPQQKPSQHSFISGSENKEKSVPEHNGHTSVKLDARIIIPLSAKNDADFVVLDELNVSLASRGFIIKHKDHCLQIKGDWEEITEVLNECREKLHKRQEVTLPVDHFLQGVANDYR